MTSSESELLVGIWMFNVYLLSRSRSRSRRGGSGRVGVGGILEVGRLELIVV